MSTQRKAERERARRLDRAIAEERRRRVARGLDDPDAQAEAELEDQRTNAPDVAGADRRDEDHR